MKHLKLIFLLAFLLSMVGIKVLAQDTVNYYAGADNDGWFWFNSDNSAEVNALLGSAIKLTDGESSSKFNPSYTSTSSGAETTRVGALQIGRAGGTAVFYFDMGVKELVFALHRTGSFNHTIAISSDGTNYTDVYSNTASKGEIVESLKSYVKSDAPVYVRITNAATGFLQIQGIYATYDLALKNDDGVMIYYNFINNNTELEVTYKGSSYSSHAYTGNVVIPEQVTCRGNIYKVTSIGYRAFCGCSDLTSVTFPNSVTTIGADAFYGCNATYYIPQGNYSYFVKNLYLGGNNRIYEMDGDMVVSETIASVPTDFFTYYDYDGDGVMEYLSYLKGTDTSYTYDYIFGFFNKYGEIKEPLDEKKSNFSPPTPVAVPINGKGDLQLIWPNDNSSIKLDWDPIHGVKDYYSLLVDVDNDGRKDLVEKYASGNKFTIRYQQPDGTFKAIEQSATMDADALKAASSSGGGGVASFADGMMVKAPKRGASSSYKAVEFVGGDSYKPGACTAVDMNDDGILDLMNNGTPVLYSYDDNKFFIGTKSRMLCPCDLNGDGEMEYVCYDGNTITLQIRESGTTFSEKTLFTNSNVKQIIYKDFDHDGDIDILAYIYEIYNGNYANGTTYFVFFRNDGDLSFKRRERNFAVNYQLKEIKDVDADGLYEMSVIDYTNQQAKILKIGTDLSVTESNYDLSDIYETPVAIGDFDNDGKVDCRYRVRVAVKYTKFSQTVNTAPQKMEAPTAVLNAEKGRLRINWKQGTDAETSACDLTYELRIGTQPASGDVLFGASLADGRRRTLEEGNMGRTLSTLFSAKSLKPGKYYISVQAIDGGGRGGEWSDDFVYEHQLMAPVIVSNYIDPVSAADTLRLDVKAPIDGAAYQWTLSEGKIIKDNGSYAECIFEHDGEHTVSLAMTIDGRTLNAEPLKVNVEPAKYVSLARDPGYVDINQDGYPEYLGYVNNGEGELEKVLLSYATSNPRSDIYMDYNMDGYPDAISGNTVYINLGEQDNDFDLETQQFDWKVGSSSDTTIGGYTTIKNWFDANNDGYLDNAICFNDGTNIVWRRYYSTDSKHALYNSRNMPTNKEWNSDIQSYVYLLGSPNYDVNRDGMLDIVEQVRETSYEYKTSWYVMFKDSTANFNYSAPQLMCTINKYVPSNQWLIDDINNDGYMDIICGPTGDNSTIERTQQLIVFKGNPTSQSIEPIIYDIPVYVKEFSALRDYNNDGYLDLCFEGYDTNYDKSNNYLCMFGPDFSMEFVEWTNKRVSSMWDKYFMVQKDGGYPDGYASNIKNLPPSAPATVAAKQTKDGLLITWSDAQDDHTPAMQMRYNISVKRKGKKGDNSFVISPMNGLIDKATICGNIMYKKSTQMLVPASVLTAGESYEIQVQAIDLWNQHSPMTPVVEFTMVSDGYIDMAEQVAVGMETSVKFVGTNADSYSLDAGADGTIVKDEGNGSYIVKWSSEGVKNVTLTAGTKTIKAAITVVHPIDLTFSVPAQVFAGAELTINVSDEMAAQPKDIGMRSDNDEVKAVYVAGSKTATVTFPETGTYELEAYSDDAVRGGSYKQIVNVVAEMPEAVIEQVNADSETGFYTVNWNATSLPTGISKVVVYKEGVSLGAFNEIAEANAADGSCVDKSSNPAVMASRYRIQLLADNGQVSKMSNAHKPLHVMMTKAVQGYNLIWDSYEGVDVASYSILRGSTPDNLEQIAQVAGSINSYTDISAPSGVSYYAVTFFKGVAAARASNGQDVAEETVNSNVISTEEAIDAVLAQSIELIVLDGDKTLSDEHPDLQLYYLLLPTYSTVTKVKWEIVEGDDLATIDANGKLHATGGIGNVLVRVSTTDGSELSAEISVPTMATKIDDPMGIHIAGTIEPTLKETRYFTLDGKPTLTPAQGQVYIEWSIYSNGQIVSRKLVKK